MEHEKKNSLKFKIWNVYLFIVAIFSVKTFSESFLLGVLSIICIVSLYSYIHKTKVLNYYYWLYFLVIYSLIIVYNFTSAFYKNIFSGNNDWAKNINGNEVSVFVVASILVFVFVHLPQLYALYKLSFNKVTFTNEKI